MKTMLRYLILIFIAIVSMNSIHAQVVISSDENVTPDSSAVLDLQSDDKGLLIPRMTTSDRLSIEKPAVGLTVYDTEVNGFYFHDGVSWIALISDYTFPKLAPLQRGQINIGGNPRDIDASGNNAFIVEANGKKLIVLDVSDEDNPSILSELAMNYTPFAIKTQGDYAYVTTLDSSTLEVIDISDPQNPSSAGSVVVGGQPLDLIVDGGFVYIANEFPAAIQIVDVSTPSNPMLRGEFVNESTPIDLAYRNQYLYAASTFPDQLLIIDVGNPDIPIAIDSLDIDGTPKSIHISNNDLFLGITDPSGEFGKVLEYGIQNSALLQFMCETKVGNNPIDIATRLSNVIILNKDNNRIEIIGDLADKSEVFGEFDFGSTVRAMDVEQRFAYTLITGVLYITELKLPSQTIAKDDEGNFVPGPWRRVSGSIFTLESYVGIGTFDPQYPLDVDGEIKANSFIGSGAELTDIDIDDADADPSNELQSWSNLPGIPAEFADNIDNINDADNDPTNELQSWSNLPGIPADFSDGVDHVNDADSDPTNELQSWSDLPGIPADFSDGVDHVNDADSDPTNELQSWSDLPGIPVQFSDGIDDVDDADNDPTNELQSWSNLPGIPAAFSDGIDHVNDADSSTTNEIQTLDEVLTEGSDGGGLNMKNLGNVGIGNASNPLTRLHVRGGVDASLTTHGYIMTGEINSTNLIIDNNEIMARDDGDGSLLYLNNDGGDIIMASKPNTGNVGIGTTTPAAKLDVNGETIIRDTLTLDQNWHFTADTDTLRLLLDATTSPMISMNYSSGFPRIGLGREPVSWVLEVEGQAGKSAAGDWFANSDMRLKKNIQKMNSQEVLKKMLKMQGVTYEWNDNKTGTTRPNGMQYGFIAQDIEKVFPEFVVEDGLGYLQTSYGTYDAMYVESIRALNQKIDRQQEIIEILLELVPDAKQRILKNDQSK